MSTPGRIDVHQHFLPPEFVTALNGHTSGVPGWKPEWGLPSWSAKGALAMMDEHETATGVLSLSTPGTHFGDNAEALALATTVNEVHAELVKDRPDRFGMFATVPLPDVDGSLAVISHAFDDLNADGVVLLANAQGTYLGDPSFEPVMAELDRRAAVVFVHPGSLPSPPVDGVHPAMADFLLDTTRATINLVLRGIPRRYPRLKIILSHGGGFVPYAAYRIAHVAGGNPMLSTGVGQEQILEDLASFYFDTAMAGSPTALPSLLAFASPSRILFGSDWPYVPAEGVTYFTDFLDAADGLDQAGHDAINRTNAEGLLPRLKRSA